MQPHESYADLIPLLGVVDRLHDLKQRGHTIIIQTARNMKTCDANVGRVMKNVGRLTLEWLDRYEIEYDEIYFGKPNANIYIDDRALRFSDWSVITDESLSELARER